MDVDYETSNGNRKTLRVALDGCDYAEHREIALQLVPDDATILGVEPPRPQDQDPTDATADRPTDESASDHIGR